jgi:putative addiction module CopG family antidote
MNLTLPPSLDAFVKDMVARGRYADEADVVRDALRRLADQDLDAETGEPLSALRQDLAETANGPRSDAGVMQVFERAVAARAPSK